MNPNPPIGAPRESRPSRVPQGVRRLLALLAVELIAVAVFVFRDRFPDPAIVAYPTLFILTLASSASILIPLPGIIAVCSGGVLLNALLVGIVAGVGETLGETTGYLAGYSGRGVVEQNRIYLRIQPWMRRRGWLFLFLFSVIPNPIFDIIGLAAGVARIPLWQFYGSVWAGKTLKSLWIAYACSLGYDLFFVRSGSAVWPALL